jgi:DNA-binding response OmpR family regulator
MALERLKVVVPVIVLLDLHLPEVLGTSILRTIRGDDRLSETLVIIATADPRSAGLVQEMADLVLIKPTTFSQVRDLAARLTAPRRKKHEQEVATKAASPAAPTAEPDTPKEETPLDPVLAASQAKTVKVPRLSREELVRKKEEPDAATPPPDSGSRQA